MATEESVLILGALVLLGYLTYWTLFILVQCDLPDMKLKRAQVGRYKVMCAKVKKSREKRAARKEAARSNDYYWSLRPMRRHYPVYNRAAYSAEIIRLADALDRLCHFLVTVWLLYLGYKYWKDQE
uniref:Uncharacterized protein n=1 Tax=Anopheles maculatus TaxID=74869 RepID=A0A182S751_9DIPT